MRIIANILIVWFALALGVLLMGVVLWLRHQWERTHVHYPANTHQRKRRARRHHKKHLRQQQKQEQEQEKKPAPIFI